MSSKFCVNFFVDYRNSAWISKVVVAVWVLPRRRRKSIRAKRTRFWWQKILMAGKKILRSFIWRPWVPVWSLLGNGLAASFCFHWILPPSCKSFPHLSHIPKKVTHFYGPSTSHHGWKKTHLSLPSVKTGKNHFTMAARKSLLNTTSKHQSLSSERLCIFNSLSVEYGDEKP